MEKHSFLLRQKSADAILVHIIILTGGYTTCSENILRKINQNQSCMRTASFLFSMMDARLYQLFPAPAGMGGGVVQERHESLNWLIGSQNSAPWDEVTTDT